MSNNFEQAKALLLKSNNILFTTHERTDGDDLGSVLALAIYMESLTKRVTISPVGGVPDSLRYLPRSEKVLGDISETDYDLVVISGCSVLDRVKNPKIMALPAPKLNIDHHPDNQMFGTVNVVDPSKSAVAELVYDFFKYCDWPITHEIALCLLTGIVTDTGIFMHSNTQASTLSAAAELMEKGARISTVTKHTYQGKDIASLKAWAKALENMQYDPKQKMIYSIITEEELQALGNPPMSAFEGIVETLNKVPEAKFAMFLKQDSGVIKGSLRSDPHKGVDVKEIAHTLGGGGHKWAAGFSILGKLVKQKDGRWEVA